MLSISTVSPTDTFSASSPSFLRGIILTLPLSLAPNPFSAETSIVFFSPAFVSGKASSSPLRTQASPTETNFGIYFMLGSWMECFFASSSFVVSKTSPLSLILAV